MERKQKPDIFFISVDSLKSGAYVIVSPDIEQVKAFVQKYFNAHDYNEWDNASVGKVYYETGHYPLIWFPKVGKTPASVAIVAHEATHCALRIIESRDITLNRDCEEVLTYLTEHIVSSIYQYMKEKNEKSRTTKKRK